MKKVWVLLLLLAASHVACEDENAACERRQHFNVKGLRLSAMVLKRNSNGVELGSEAVPDLDSVMLQDYYLEGYLEADYYALNNPGFSLLPAALATSPCPAPGYNGSEEKIDSLAFIALGNFSPQYPAGSSLNPLVLMDGQPVNTYLARNAEGIKDQIFRITLTQKPANRKVYQAFKLVYKLQNGERYQVQTARVKLL